MKSHSKSEPQARLLHYEEVVYLCARCGCDCRRVYLRGGRWYCLPCLRAVAKLEGGTMEEVFGAARQAEGTRGSSGLRCLEVSVRDRRQKLIEKGLIHPRSGKAQLSDEEEDL